MRRIARRLDRHGTAVDFRGQDTLGLKLVEHFVQKRGISGVKAQFGHQIRKARPLAHALRRVTITVQKPHSSRFGTL
ncbi:hypothetical protein [Sphingomonas sediminicola]|uniref:hypothetical protein n=1 Tax=Sphingomonas sediminicola TaxID=386874 RepID=UPI001FEA12DE|nr:hypothetical protein [Sphingomonas sediminicola]